MPYLIDATDAPGQAKLRQTIRPSHLAYLEDNVRLILAAGAKLSEDGAPLGSYYLLDVDERSAAEAFIAADPYQKAGVFGAVSVTRCRRGFFDFKRTTPGT